jgi:small-conductance mechanosensitive channel
VSDPLARLPHARQPPNATAFAVAAAPFVRDIGASGRRPEGGAELSAVDFSENTVQALLAAAFWLAFFVVLRWVLRRAFTRWQRRLGPESAARQRTLYSVLERILLAIVVVIALWNVLSTFDATAEIARAILASSAAIAILAGVALSTPLGNMGAGLLVAISQPVRLGDRVTIGETTGFVEEITLIYTVLLTDDNRHVYVPNTQLTAAPIVNRTITDPRRTVSVTAPVAIAAPFDEARGAVLGSLEELLGTQVSELRVSLGEIGEKAVWLEVTALAPPEANVAALASEVRERTLGALRTAALLPS